MCRGTLGEIMWCVPMTYEYVAWAVTFVAWLAAWYWAFTSEEGSKTPAI